MSYEANDVLHIGYPKTATTSLQRNFLSDLTDTDLIGELPSREKSLLDFKESPYGGNLLQVKDFKTQLNNFRKNQSAVLSDELVLGPSRRISEQGFLAAFLYELFPRAKVLVTIRNQEDILKSIYASHPSLWLSTLGVSINSATELASLRRLTFNKWLRILLKQPLENFAGLLLFPEVVSYWTEVFGKSNVYVITYEAIRDNPKQLDSTMSHLFPQSNKAFSSAMKGQKHRSRRNESKRAIALLKKKVKWHLLWKRSTIDPSFLKTSGPNKERLEYLYSAENWKFEAAFGLPLSDLNYLVKPQNRAQF